MRIAAVCGLAIVAAVTAAQMWAQAPAPTRILSDIQIRNLLAERIDTYRQSVGIVVGIIEPQGRRIVSYGTRANGDPRPVAGDSVFEIGSITKLFTSLLLADMVRRGEVALDDPVAKYLPPGVKVPERKGRHITLVDLATHMSGLPREAPNFEPDLADWAAGYSEASLYEFLGSHQLTEDIGASNEYSNVGAALLGIALARRAGMDYGALVRARIGEPMGLDSTGVSLTPEMTARVATGHFFRLNPAPHMNLGVFAGAGALWSTTNDLLTFLGAQLGYQQTPLAPAMAAMLAVERPLMPPVVRIFVRESQHLGWFAKKNILWHNGGTLGYMSFIGFDPKTRSGVVVLANAKGGAGVDDIGMHLLNPKEPLLGSKAMKPPQAHREIPVTAEVLDRYVGRYEVSSNDYFTVTRIGDQFLVDGNTDPVVRFYPESDVNFFSKEFEGTIAFKVDRAGRATELMWSAPGGNKRYKRVQ